ncbi:PREDICTED: uncharacterized protein LOC106820829 [Priapulus caudatus]|uniref:Uncharacterized protein LOC106820829 n=1 Tax=Priapulus caudatus TaxID=37621 RepID=A0ABM1F8W9_PRICU|nr:PREDICTED: uncharacterized protein LOC106820829 [Priapulus caudatus]
MVRRTIRCLPALHGDCVRACLALCVLALACDLSRGGRVGGALEKAFLAELGIREPPLRESGGGGDRGGPPHDYMVRVSAAMERYARQQQDSSSGGYATDGRPEAVRVTSYPAVSVSDRHTAPSIISKFETSLRMANFPLPSNLS